MIWVLILIANIRLGWLYDMKYQQIGGSFQYMHI